MGAAVFCLNYLHETAIDAFSEIDMKRNNFFLIVVMSVFHNPKAVYKTATAYI